MTVRAEVVAVLDELFDRRVAADKVPVGGFARPYARVIDPLFETPAFRGDGKTMGWRRTFQVDVYEDADKSDGTRVSEVVAALDGRKITGALRVYVRQTIRVPEPDLDVVHTAVSCSVGRLST